MSAVVFRKRYKTANSKRKSSELTKFVPSKRKMVAVLRATAEKKGVDHGLGDPAVMQLLPLTYGVSVFVVNIMSQGPGYYQRIGNKVHWNSLRVKGVATWHYQADNFNGLISAGYLRMIVVWDKQPNGGVFSGGTYYPPLFEDIFGLTGASGSETTTLQSPVRYDAMDRFIVLREKIFTGEPKLLNFTPTIYHTTQVNFLFDEYIDMKGRETLYSGNSSPPTIHDISTGGIYVYFRSSLDDPPEGYWSIAGSSYTRLRYTDV